MKFILLSLIGNVDIFLLDMFVEFQLNDGDRLQVSIWLGQMVWIVLVKMCVFLRLVVFVFIQRMLQKGVVVSECVVVYGMLFLIWQQFLGVCGSLQFQMMVMFIDWVFLCVFLSEVVLVNFFYFLIVIGKFVFFLIWKCMMFVMVWLQVLSEVVICYVLRNFFIILFRIGLLLVFLWLVQVCFMKLVMFECCSQLLVFVQVVLEMWYRRWL